MKIGFTGTREGLTEKQKQQLSELILDVLQPTEFHHGDCIGADKNAHDIVRLFSTAHITSHPPANDSARAYCHCDSTRKALPYLERNRCIVDETEVLIACPKTKHEQLRSGTWATVRYARSLNRRIYLILPNGELK